MRLPKGIMGGAAVLLTAVAMVAAPTFASADEAAVDADALVIAGATANATVCWVTTMCGAGNGYSFNGGTCLGLFSAEAQVPADVEVAAGCSASSAGTFVNVICGTGLVTGGATATESGGSDSYNFGITVVLIAGQGVLIGTGDGPAVGVVDLNPPSGGLNLPPSLGGTCTTSFLVNVVAVTTA
ncbi:MAG TPA: hypothetical protein VG245_01165 [Candidatus Dormibacteraeota bacterium]|jgi:hypothetical protein|nr:hypothetical protein [Candidatus Dormibacteraeota bacterium]